MRRLVRLLPVALGLLLFVGSVPAATKQTKKAMSQAKGSTAKSKAIAARSKANEARISQARKGKKNRSAKVETLTFGAQEVEGRLRSPQILYFLRRVRAQFAPRPLGHRSFLLELADTRRSTALR